MSQMKDIIKENKIMKALFINIILFGVGIGVVLILLIELIIFGIYKLINYICYRRWPYDYGKR